MFQDYGRKTSDWAAGLIDHNARANGPPPQKLLPFIGWCLSGSWRAIGLSSLLNGTGGVIEVGMMMALGAAVQAAVTGTPETIFAENWLLFLGSILLILVLRPLTLGASNLMQTVCIGPNLFNLVLSRLHRHTIGQSVTFFDNDFAGRIAQKQMQSARALTDTVTELINAGTFAISSVIATGAVIGVYHPALLVVLLAWLAAYIALMAFFMPRVRVRSARRAAERAMVTGQVVDTITNIKTVKLFARAAHEDAAAIGSMERLRDSAIHWGELTSLFRMGLIAIAGVLPVALVGLAIWLWAGGQITPGQMTTLGAMGIRLSQMTGWVSWTLLTVYSNLGEVEDGMNTLSHPHTLTDQRGAKAVQNLTPEVHFDHVSFAYGTDTGGIRDINLRIAPGEKLGLVGASGAGKSTLTSLLLRLYDAEQGQVLVGGHDVRHLTQESLRQHIGLVTQETEMFNRSARENILYGRPEASEAEVIAAVEKAEASDFIHALRDHEGRTGFEARLGERGVKLSGGQRQRIALARALLKDAPILVLDEATSALDSEVEAHIQKALRNAMEGKTVIAIAHRLSTLSDMDRIVVLDQGRIAEQGSHAALLAQDGLYARYWQRQSGGFIGIDE